MRNMRTLFILLIALLCVIIATLPLTSATGQEQAQANKKFRPASAESKIVRPDVWIVTLDREKIKTEEDFEREAQRLLATYEAKLDTGQPDIIEHDYRTNTIKRIKVETKSFSMRWLVVIMPRERAEKMAEDPVVKEVFENHVVMPIENTLKKPSMSPAKPITPPAQSTPRRVPNARPAKKVSMQDGAEIEAARSQRATQLCSVSIARPVVYL